MDVVILSGSAVVARGEFELELDLIGREPLATDRAAGAGTSSAPGAFWGAVWEFAGANGFPDSGAKHTVIAHRVAPS